MGVRVCMLKNHLRGELFWERVSHPSSSGLFGSHVYLIPVAMFKLRGDWCLFTGLAKAENNDFAISTQIQHPDFQI